MKNLTREIRRRIYFSSAIILISIIVIIGSFGIVRDIGGCGSDYTDEEVSSLEEGKELRGQVNSSNSQLILAPTGIRAEKYIELAEMGPFIHNIITHDGKYVVIPTNKSLKILKVNCAKTNISRDPISEVPEYSNSCIIATINYPTGYITEKTKPAYEFSGGKHYIYTGWNGPNGIGGHIARIDITNPANPAIKVSTLPSRLQLPPPHLRGAIMEQVVIAGDYIVTHPSPVKMEGSDYEFPQYLTLFKKSTLILLGSVATNYENRFTGNLAPLSWNPFSDVLNADYPIWPYSLTNYTSDFTVTDGRYITWVNNDKSLQIFDINSVNFTTQPEEYCTMDTNTPTNSCYGRTELYFKEPIYECFMDNYYNEVENNLKYQTQSSNFHNAFGNMRCAHLYEENSSNQTNTTLFNSDRQWFFLIQPVALKLPTGKRVLVVAGGQPSYMTLWDLDPLITGNSNPSLLKIVALQSKYLSFFAINNSTFCGDFTNLGYWHSSFECWKIFHFTESNNELINTNINTLTGSSTNSVSKSKESLNKKTKKTLYNSTKISNSQKSDKTVASMGNILADQYALFPVGAINHHDRMHSEKIFGRAGISNNGLFIVGGDKNVVIYDLTKSILSPTCLNWTANRAGALKSALTSLNIEQHFDLYPQGAFTTPMEKIYNSPCSALYKKTTSTRWVNTNFNSDSKYHSISNLPGLKGVIYLKFTTWPGDVPVSNHAQDKAFMQEWLTGARIFYKDWSGWIRDLHVPYTTPDYQATAWVLSNYSGSKLYIWPQFADYTEQYQVGSGPSVTYQQRIQFGVTIRIPGGYYDDGATSTRYGVSGDNADGAFDPDNAQVRIFNTESGTKRIIDYSLNDYLASDLSSDLKINMRAGGGIGDYYYAPISVQGVDSNNNAIESIYLMTINMENVLNSSAETVTADNTIITSVIPFNSIINVPFNGEFMNDFRVDSVNKIGVFVTYNGSELSAPSLHGVIVNLGESDSNGNRVATSQPVLASFSINPNNESSYSVDFGYNAYTHNGYWYAFDRLNSAVVVYEPEITGSSITFNKIDLISLYPMYFDRHIAFVGGRGVVISPAGAYSFPLY